MASDDDKCGPQCAGNALDLADRVALCGLRRYPHPAVHAGECSGDDRLAFGLDLLQAAGKELRFPSAQERGFGKAHDVANDDLCAKIRGKRCGGVKCAGRRVGTVYRNENLHDAALDASGSSVASTRTVKTGIGALRSTPSATLPVNRRFMPERPCVPITIASALIRLA